MKPSHRIAFAQDLASYIVQKLPLPHVKALRSIVLFGSSARFEADPDSDLDLFVETPAARRLEPCIRRLVDDFLSSVKCQQYWTLLDTLPDIQLVVATRQQSKTLLPGLLADGITLYGPYRAAVTEGTPYVLFTWSNIKSSRTQTNVYRRLYGYRAHGKFFSGLVEQHDVKKLNPGCLLVPLEAAKTFRKVFQGLGVQVRVWNVILY